MNATMSLTSTLAASMFAALAEAPPATEVSSSADRASVVGPSSSFVGNVTVTPLFTATELSNPSAFGLHAFPGVWDWYLQWRERRPGFNTN